MLIFDFSLSNVFYFIGFFILLLSLGMGIIRALQGKKPIITLRSLSLKEIARHVHPTNIDTVEKIPMALSHIPLIGNFVAAKYGASFSSGERFATWSVIIGIVFDRSEHDTRHHTRLSRDSMDHLPEYLSCDR
jgi:hypothetical protein